MTSILADSTVAKYKKRNALRERRYALLEKMNEICSPTSRRLWEEQLALAYRERTIHVKDAMKDQNSYNAKYMDKFLKTSFVGMI